MLCVISKPQGFEPGSAAHTETKGLSEIVVSSAGGQSGENLSLPVTFAAKNSSHSSRLGSGQHLSDRARLETTGLFIHLHLTGTAEEQGRYCYLFMAQDKAASIGSLTLH